jgi:hypothetical protein
MTPTILEELASEVARIIRRDLGTHEVRQIWTEGHRVLFRLQDGRTGDVEVVANWDVVAEGGEGDQAPEEALP